MVTSTRISSSRRHAHNSHWHCEISQSAHKTQYGISSEKKRGKSALLNTLNAAQSSLSREPNESLQSIQAERSQSCFHNLHISSKEGNMLIHLSCSKFYGFLADYFMNPHEFLIHFCQIHTHTQIVSVIFFKMPAGIQHKSSVGLNEICF